MKQLITGGIKSGKSNYAQQQALATHLPVTYIATATALDDEMHQRIRQHQQSRPSQWALVEEPIKLAHAIANHATANRCLIVDCLTLWLTNLLLHPDENLLHQEIQQFESTLINLQCDIIIVSNESNLGIIPDSALARRYCDQAGLLHQRLAQICDRVIMMIMGLAQILKG